MNHKTELENIAQEIIHKSGLSSDNHGSIILTLMFISIILTCIRVFQECNKNKDAKFYTYQIKLLANKRSWLTKLRLKRILKKELNAQDYQTHKEQIVTAILDVAEKLTEEQVSKILEVKS